MQRLYEKSHNTISLGDLTFEIISYKVDHVKTVSSYFTISNNTGMYTNGIKPYILTVKGYFSKTNGNTIITILEDFLTSNNGLSFNIDGVSFSNVTLNRYSFKEDISSMYQECEISFMGIDSISNVGGTSNE